VRPIYKTSATIRGGITGRVTSEDGVLDVEVRTPKSVGGVGGRYTNSEQLFAAGYASCLDSSLHYVAKKLDKKITTTIKATVGLKPSIPDGLVLDISVDVSIQGVDSATAELLLEKAYQTCPYSKAIRNNVDVKINLVDVIVEE
jgi:lipoyl-dependent peroxiredoxin